MSDAERLETLDCGCRQDKVTGVKTHLCDAHDPEKQMAKVAHALRNARVPLSLPYNPSEERY